MAKVKVLLTDFSYIKHNYGAQGIILPLTKKLSNYLDVEFTVALSLAKRWKDFFNIIFVRFLSDIYGKKYLKYTKSYGPFPTKIYSYFVKKHLNKLPFLFIRGNRNMETLKAEKLKTKMYSFPDISFGLKPEDVAWAEKCLTEIGLNLNKPIFGISPTVVINNILIKGQTCGDGHILLVRNIIKYFKSKKNVQILFIPHSLDDGLNLQSCDLALCRMIYNSLEDKEDIFLLDGLDFTYQQVRSIINKLGFYVTGRYHSLCSALSVGIPVVSLSWHIKYMDAMSMFFKNPLVINCRNTNVETAMELIEKYESNRDWYNKSKMIKVKKDIENSLDESIKIIIEELKR